MKKNDILALLEKAYQEISETPSDILIERCREVAMDYQDISIDCMSTCIVDSFSEFMVNYSFASDTFMMQRNAFYTQQDKWANACNDNEDLAA